MKFPEENRWEAFARDNAKYYVDTNFLNYSADEREEKFFSAGRELTNQTLARVEEMLPDKRRALEIGAGVGRLTLPHANIFEEVVAVDISPTMLKKLEQNAQRKNLDDIIYSFLPEEPWDKQKISYAYSYLVFQHIVDFAIIENYINRIAECLKAGGIAQLQFDTRKKTLPYRIRDVLPNFMLPKNQRKGIRRKRRKAQTLRHLFIKNKFLIQEEIKSETSTHIFVLRKMPDSD